MLYIIRMCVYGVRINCPAIIYISCQIFDGRRKTTLELDRETAK